MTTSGSSEANFLLMWSRLERGEELRRLVTKRTKLIVLTNPNNPTGAVLSPEAMDGIVGLAEKSGAWILADEVYRGAERDGVRTPSFWGRYDKVLVVNGLSKAYGLPGPRVGWIHGPEDGIKRTWPYHDYTTISPSALSDRMARIALAPETRERLLERTRRILNRNFPVLEAWLKRRRDLFTFLPPRAGAICFVRYALKMNSTALVERILRQRSVLVVSGDHFATDGYLRLGFGSTPAILRAGLARIGKTLHEIHRP